MCSTMSRVMQLLPKRRIPHTLCTRNLISVRDGMMTSRDSVVTSRDCVMTSRDGVMTSRDGVMTSRDGVMTSRDGVVTSRDRRGVNVYCPYREYREDKQDRGSGSENKSRYNKVSVLGTGLLAASFFGGDNKETTLKRHIGMCTMHLHQGEPEQAKPHFDQAYEMLKSDMNRNKDTPVPNLKIAYLTDQLGNIALQLECYREAINLYMATINGFALNGIERNNRSVTELFLKIGQIYAILGEYKLAEMSFLHCVGVTTVELAREDMPNSPKSITLAGLAYEGLGKLYLTMNQPENALNMYKSALQFADKVFEPNDPQIPVLLNDFATVYEALDDYDNALEQAEKAIEKAKLYNKAALPTILCNKASILLFSGDLKSARAQFEDLLQKCLKMQDYETAREIKANMRILEDKERLQKENLAD